MNFVLHVLLHHCQWYFVIVLRKFQPKKVQFHRHCSLAPRLVGIVISVLFKGEPKRIVSTPLRHFLVLYFQLVEDFQYGYVEFMDVPGKEEEICLITTYY